MTFCPRRSQKLLPDMKETMMFKSHRLKLLSVTALALTGVVSGCNLGPRYTPPAPPSVTAPNYKESSVNFQDQPGWKVASPQDAMLRGKWWEVFNEPELNE